MEDVAQVDEPCDDVVDVAVDDLARDRIALFERGKRRARGDLAALFGYARKHAVGRALDRRLGLLDQSRRGRIPLPAAAQPAIALQPVFDDDHMPRLAACGRYAAEQPAFQNDAAAHARAERDEDDVAHPLAATVLVLAPSGAVGVVRRLGVLACQHLEKVCDRDVAPAEIGAIADCAGALIDDAGDAHADALDGVKVDFRALAKFDEI